MLEEFPKSPHLLAKQGSHRFSTNRSGRFSITHEAGSASRVSTYWDNLLGHEVLS